MRKLLGSIVCSLCGTVLAQNPPATQPAELPNVTISDMKVEDLQGMTFLHYEQKTTMTAMMQTISKDIQNLMITANAAHIDRRGPLTILMRGVSDNPNHPFDLQVGFKVNKGTAAPTGYVVTDVPSTKTAVVLFSGPLMQVRQAYGKLYTSIFGAGLAPSMNIREYILYYEDVDSPNNVAMAGVELQ
ncbi:MAG TPA: hypothetical protein VGG19_19180 [Tepidisphaeraceae bacterium]|jgi:predicted transcriptional regulator YdeE